jgi:hypothetical protein
MCKILCAAFFCCLIYSQQIFAQSVVKVGVVGEAPFVVYQNGMPSGLVVNMWGRVAEKMQLPYQWIPMGTNVDAALMALTTGQVNMVIGSTGVTSARLKDYTFSRPIFINELALVTMGKPENFFDVIKIVIAPFLKTSSIILASLLLIFSLIHWCCEYRQQKKPLNIKTFFESVWIIIVGILAVGYPQWPYTFLARLLALFTLLLGIVFTAIFSAAVTTSLTISSSLH